MKFPLPADTFPQITMASNDIVALENIAHDLVQERMDDYHEHIVMRHGDIDGNFWKKIKVREQISVYKERHVDPTATNAPMPMMLTVGTIEGNLDDVMYGALNHSTHDMRIRTAYLGDKMCDGRQLASLVKPSRVDPLRSLTFKWRVKENCALTPPLLVRLRDAVVMEGTGFASSATGEHFGYHLVHSVSLPDIHELDEYNIVRCHISMCFLYRQVADNIVSVYAKGILKSCGSIPLTVLTLGAAESFLSIGRYVECANLKKLAWLARTTNPTDFRLENPSVCSVCSRKLKSAHPDDTKSRCSACRERICCDCTVMKKLPCYLPHKLNELSMLKMNFCQRCFERAKQMSSIEVASYEVVESVSDTTYVRDSASSVSSQSTISDDTFIVT